MKRCKTSINDDQFKTHDITPSNDETLLDILANNTKAKQPIDLLSTKSIG